MLKSLARTVWRALCRNPFSAKALLSLVESRPFGLVAARWGDRREPSAPASPEDILVDRYFKDRKEGVIIDVGAHIGRYVSYFAAKGWRGFAIEPELRNYVKLKLNTLRLENVRTLNAAVSDSAGQDAELFVSDEHWGIHALRPWHGSHRASCKVACVRLDAFCRETGIGRIDFLKIDTEGNDFNVLKSLDFDAIQPEVIMVEFVDSRTIPFFGYSARDMIEHMARRGYAGCVVGFAEVASPSREGQAGEPLKYCYIGRADETWWRNSWAGNIIFYRKENQAFGRLLDAFLETEANAYVDVQAAFRDCHKGRRCFVICNGPSINAMDLTKLQGELTFGCNRIHRNRERMGFDVAYYFSTDSIIAIATRQEAMSYVRKEGVAAGFFLPCHQKYIVGRKCFHTRDDSWSIGMGMIRMALLMGCDPIYVIGLDLDFNYPEEDDRDNYAAIEDLPLDRETRDILAAIKDNVSMKGVFTLKGSTGDASHFSKDYLSNLPAHFVTTAEAVAAYEEFGRSLSDRERGRIANAGIGGNCGAFRRVEYNTLF